MKKLNIKDIITTGLYSAVYFMLVGIGTLISVVLLPSSNMMYAPMCIALISGIAYYLLIYKVQKFGAVLLLGMVMATFFFMSGHFILSFVPSILFGFTADIIGNVGKYKHKIINLCSYVIFSMGNLGPIILMWFAKEQYVRRLLSKGKTLAEIDAIIIGFSFSAVLRLVLSIVIAAIIGGIFADRLIQKHFKKAGMVQ